MIPKNDYHRLVYHNTWALLQQQCLYDRLLALLASCPCACRAGHISDHEMLLIGKSDEANAGASHQPKDKGDQN